MADDKSTRRSLLGTVKDQEPSSSTAIWMDAPGRPAAEGKGAEAAKGGGLLPKRDPAAAGTNVRRSHLAGRQLVISLVTSLVVGLAVHFADRNYFEKELAARGYSVPSAAGAGVASAEQAGSGAGAKASEQIIALQKQLDVVRREQLLNQQSTRESLERISDVLKNPQLAPAPVAGGAAEPGQARLADAAVAVSPTQAEFIQLKERNRLTQYADEAIATGMRKPLEAIVAYLSDPASKHLHDAAQAEYMRAVRAIQILQRGDPGYRLPVTELFKGSNAREEADLKPEALHKLLADHETPWEARARACFLLLGSNAPDTNAKLIQAIKDDPSLEVAKQAQIALEQRVKRRFRIFDIPAIDEWWSSQSR